MSVALKMTEDSELEQLVQEVSKLVNKLSGIQLDSKQTAMVRSRLLRRMSEVGVSGASTYRDYLSKHMESESSALVSLLTTHHTFFFREFEHFEFLATRGLKEIFAANPGKKHLKVWSMACSRGQEVYSLAMYLLHHLPKIAPGCSLEIIGTDIDRESVSVAQNGVYLWDELKTAPSLYVSGHWSRGTGDIANYVRAKASLRDVCRFESRSLMQLSPQEFGGNFDLIFCRNVFIYFNQEQIKSITNTILKLVSPTGYFFTGVSESLKSIGVELDFFGPSIYGLKRPDKPKHVAEAGKKVAAPDPARPIRVLVVDDSPIIVKLLKAILTPDKGFDVVAAAGNGIEATKILSATKVDIMTLDIHMPEEDGLTYLKKNFKADHPPVVMISSVSREDADLAMQCIKLGAADYVEKPMMSNIEKSSEEIRAKLKVTFEARRAGDKVDASVDASFAQKFSVSSPDTKLRLISMGLADEKKVAAMLPEIKGTQPPTIIAISCKGATFEAAVKSLSVASGKKIETTMSGHLAKDCLYAIEAQNLSSLLLLNKDRVLCAAVVGNAEESIITAIKNLKNRHVIVEDLASVRSQKSLADLAQDSCPATSFIYATNQFFTRKAGN